jgi:hypothetical protein
MGRNALGDGAHCSCASRHAAELFNDNNCAESVRINSAEAKNLETLEEDGATNAPRKLHARILLTPLVV